MISKATIETRREGDGLIVDARYRTPEWVRFVETIWWPLTLLGWAGLSIGCWRWLGDLPIPLSANEAIFWGSVVSSIAFAMAWAIVRALTWVGGGFALAPSGTARLEIRIARDRLSWQGAVGKGAIDREGWQVRFVPRPHRRGRYEERDAALSQAPRSISYAYRDAWEIWLQVGERFFNLAAVSNEADADAIARRLQAADAEATRPRQKQRRSA